MKLKKYKKKKISSYFTLGIIIVFSSLSCAFLVIDYFSRSINEIILPMATDEARKYVSLIINGSTDDIKFDEELFNIDKDKNNEIKMITYNSLEVTKLTNQITHNIEKNFEKLENKNLDLMDGIVIEEIPLGVIYKNGFLRNMGPRIKVRIDIVSSVLSELQTEVKPYGLNNALVEVKVFLDATARVVLPFVSEEIKVTNVIPISITVVNGSIPEAYIASYK